MNDVHDNDDNDLTFVQDAYDADASFLVVPKLPRQDTHKLPVAVDASVVGAPHLGVHVALPLNPSSVSHAGPSMCAFSRDVYFSMLSWVHTCGNVLEATGASRWPQGSVRPVNYVSTMNCVEQTRRGRNQEIQKKWKPTKFKLFS